MKKEILLKCYLFSVIALVFSSLAVVLCIGLSDIEPIVKISSILVFVFGTNILMYNIFTIFKKKER